LDDIKTLTDFALAMDGKSVQREEPAELNRWVIENVRQLEQRLKPHRIYMPWQDNAFRNRDKRKVCLNLDVPKGRPGWEELQFRIDIVQPQKHYEIGARDLKRIRDHVVMFFDGRDGEVKDKPVICMVERTKADMVCLRVWYREDDDDLELGDDFDYEPEQVAPERPVGAGDVSYYGMEDAESGPYMAGDDAENIPRAPRRRRVQDDDEY
jgi:hypothetical protein